MTDTTNPEIVATLDDDTGDRFVEVEKHAEGHFTFTEYHRDPDREDAWFEVAQPDPKTYKTQYAAYASAMQGVEWLTD